MQFRLLAAVTIFLGSYLPLSLILLAQDYRYEFLESRICVDFSHFDSRCAMPLQNPGYSIAIFGICLVCFLVTLVAINVVRAKRTIIVKSAKYVPAELMNYSLPYVVAFMSISYSDTGKFTGLLIFLAWMFWLTYRSGQLLLNPLLIAFGWKLYEINYLYPGNSVLHTAFALADGPVSAEEEVKYVSVQEILVLKTR